MKGKVVYHGETNIVVKMEDGTLVRHAKNEQYFKVGEEIVTLEGKPYLFLPATNGHGYLTIDYMGKADEIEISPAGYIL